MLGCLSTISKIYSDELAYFFQMNCNKNNPMNKNSYHIRCLTGLIFILIFQGCMKGSSEYDHGINTIDKTFVSQGLHLHEIIASASALVPERSESSELETFAANTHNEQLQLFRELDSVNNFIQLKASAEKNLAHVELNNKLVQLNGHHFDTIYLNTMLIYHQKAVEIYNSQLAAGSNNALKNFASKKIEFLRAQLQMVEMLYKKYQ
jgi:predicted outer membrane protein